MSTTGKERVLDWKQAPLLGQDSTAVIRIQAKKEELCNSTKKWSGGDAIFSSMLVE